MKRTLLPIILMLFPFMIQAEGTPVSTKVEGVTVFNNGAQIVRSAQVTLQAGSTTVDFTSLSPDIEERSIKVKSEGKGMVMSVTFDVNYLVSKEISQKMEGLRNKKEEISAKLEVENNMLNVYQQEEQVLMENKKLGSEQVGVKVLELRDAANFYRERLTEIKLKQLEVKKNSRKLSEELAKLNAQITQLHGTDKRPTGEIHVLMNAKSAGSTKVILSYITRNAGWKPSYDLRVKDISKPVSLIYKANVFQNSGEDWEEVRLRLSTADPDETGSKPVLSPRYLASYSDYNRGTIAPVSYGQINSGVREVRGKVMNENGEGLPGVSVVVTGTTVGVASDANGNYSIAIPGGSQTLTFSYVGYTSQEIPISSSSINVSLTPDLTSLSEVVVVGYGTSADAPLMGRMPGIAIEQPRQKKEKKVVPVQTVQVQNSTSVEFDIKIPYTIPSNGKSYTVEMEEYAIPAIYEYYAVPKLDKDAFLTAKILDWEDLNLLTGEANLFFEDTYVGKSLLNADAKDDTLSLSLGRDKNITIIRSPGKNYTSQQLIGANKKELKVWEINIRNKKAFPISIVIEDQVPVSSVKEVQVDHKELSGAELESETGKVLWKLNLKPSESKKLDLRYEVKYPKDLRLIVD